MIRHKREWERATEPRVPLRRFPAGPMIGAAVALIVSASVAFGQDFVGPTQLELADGEPAQIRTRILEILAATEFIAKRQGAQDAVATAAFARDAFSEMADAELDIYAGQLPALTRLAGILDLLANEYGGSEWGSSATRGTRASGPSAASNIATDFSKADAVYSSQCPSPRRSSSSMKGFLTGLQVAEGIADGLRRACDQLVCGFNGAAACLISDGVWLGVKIVFEQRAFCLDDIDSAEILGSFDRTEHIHADLDLARAEILANKNLIIAARVTILQKIQKGIKLIIAAIDAMGQDIVALLNAEFDCQNAELLAWRNTSVRTLIEEDLGRGVNVDRIASFQLPASIVCAGAIDDVPCGSLETVEAVVKDIIAGMKDAGLDTFDAQSFLQKGRHAFSLQDYKVAYQYFTTAYRLATGLEPPPLGACCRADGACKDAVLLGHCSGAEEVWHEGLACVEVNPPCLSGACCRADGTCTDAVLEDGCVDVGDVWHDDLACVDLDPPCSPPGRPGSGMGDTPSRASRLIGGQR